MALKNIRAINAQERNKPTNQCATFSAFTVVYAKRATGTGFTLVAGYCSPRGV